MTSLDSSDTIAAIATPVGDGSRGMVRVTGPEAWPVALGDVRADRFIRSAKRPARWSCPYRLAGVRRPIRVDVGFWPAPRTYTGQHLAEISLVGSTPLVRAVLSECLARGARLAEPGEFTLRAFLSGRIDLTEAEAVLGVIDASNSAQLDQALRQLAGGLASPVRKLRDRMADLLAHLEANLDFAEEPDVDPLGVEQLARFLDEAAGELQALVGRLGTRDRAAGRPKVVLVGPPNAGKSRLFNVLTERDRAIVSPIAGTTRDYLEATCVCDGLEVNLIDTAGLDGWVDAIEGRAQKATSYQLDTADLILDCRADDTSLAGFARLSSIPTLYLRTKADLTHDPIASGRHPTSALNGEGLDMLRRAIASALLSRSKAGDLTSATAARCGESLAGAWRSLESASRGLRRGIGDELVAIDVRRALDDLGRVVGAVVTEDLLDRIFRRFCIGK